MVHNLYNYNTSLNNNNNIIETTTTTITTPVNPTTKEIEFKTLQLLDLSTVSSQRRRFCMKEWVNE